MISSFSNFSKRLEIQKVSIGIYVLNCVLFTYFIFIFFRMTISSSGNGNFDKRLGIQKVSISILRVNCILFFSFLLTLVSFSLGRQFLLSGNSNFSRRLEI